MGNKCKSANKDPKDPESPDITKLPKRRSDGDRQLPFQPCQHQIKAKDKKLPKDVNCYYQVTSCEFKRIIHEKHFFPPVKATTKHIFEGSYNFIVMTDGEFRFFDRDGFNAETYPDKKALAKCCITAAGKGDEKTNILNAGKEYMEPGHTSMLDTKQWKNSVKSYRKSPVIWAGTFKVDKEGTFVGTSGISGHFKPEFKIHKRKILKEFGLSENKNWIEPWKQKDIVDYDQMSTPPMMDYMGLELFALALMVCMLCFILSCMVNFVIGVVCYWFGLNSPRSYVGKGKFYQSSEVAENSKV